jgi:adenosine deaminase
VPPREFAERARRLLLVVLAARDAASAATGKPMLVRLGLSRTFESEAHYRAMAAIVPEHKDALCGLDVLGIVMGPDKEPMPPALRTLLLELRQHLPDLTIHAGEFEGHASVDRSLELEPQAIGHGVRSVESDDTLQRLADQGVTLEVCPTSNRLLIPTSLGALQARRGMAPLRALQQAHVHCVLGSDDPTPMGTSFGAEWQHAHDVGADLAQLEHDMDRRWAQLPHAR